MSESKLQEQLRDTFKHRAMLYFHFFDELRKEVGEEKASEILRRAIYQRGLAMGKRFAKHAPDGLEGLTQAFLASTPGNGEMFSPEVERCDAEGVDIKLHSCPLKEAWEEAGIGDEDMAKMAHIAGVVDNGTFEGAGFEFHAETWRPGQEGCCHLHIRPGRK